MNYTKQLHILKLLFLAWHHTHRHSQKSPLWRRVRIWPSPLVPYLGGRLARWWVGGAVERLSAGPGGGGGGLGGAGPGESRRRSVDGGDGLAENEQRSEAACHRAGDHGRWWKAATGGVTRSCGSMSRRPIYNCVQVQFPLDDSFVA